MNDTNTAKTPTVGAVAEALGLSVRTLHHWDQVGLVSPSGRSEGGYRLYSAADIERAQQVRTYRELGVPLADVGALVNGPDEAVTQRLREQRAGLTSRFQALADMIEGVDRMIEAREAGVHLTPAQQMKIFGDDWDPRWLGEAKQQWGDTQAWEEYRRRSSRRGKEQWQRIADAAHGVEARLAQAMDAGLQPGGAEANDLAEEHRATLDVHFPVGHHRHVCLARMYVADPRFTAHYDKVRQGLAAWLLSVVEANAQAHGVDLDAVEWDG